MTQVESNGQVVQIGPHGILGYQDVVGGDIVLENIGSVLSGNPNQAGAPAEQFVQVSVNIPKGGLPYVKISLSFNQYNGSSEAQLWFSRNSNFLGWRTLLPHNIVDVNGDDTGEIAASGGTLTMIEKDVPEGTHIYSIWLWAFTPGNAELLTDPSRYPTYLLVEGI